jgi:hypothetical protein
LNKEQLRASIVSSLTKQGFSVNGHIVPSSSNKDFFRTIQSHSRNEQIEAQKKFIKRSLPVVEQYSLNGWDLNPNEIEFELKVVEPGTVEETLYRYWNLVWWSVPYQKAYGRQIRFILWDKAHNAPAGIIGLQSPILRMSVRDSYLKIPKPELDYWVNKSMQAQRLGAIPPYNQIIGGKMVALAMTSNELRNFYKSKYENARTLLKDRIIEPDLLFLTTTSAFGRSSIYNRLRFNGEAVAQSLGYTKGSGTFHIGNEIYKGIQSFLQSRGVNTNTTFGHGPSRKVKLLDKAFSLLGINNYHYHNIHREFYLFSLVKNLHAVIHAGDAPSFYDRPLAELTVFWKERWALKRYERGNGWIDFDSKEFTLRLNKIIHG